MIVDAWMKFPNQAFLLDPMPETPHISGRFGFNVRQHCSDKGYSKLIEMWRLEHSVMPAR